MVLIIALKRRLKIRKDYPTTGVLKLYPLCDLIRALYAFIRKDYPTTGVLKPISLPFLFINVASQSGRITRLLGYWNQWVDKNASNITTSGRITRLLGYWNHEPYSPKRPILAQWIRKDYPTTGVLKPETTPDRQNLGSLSSGRITRLLGYWNFHAPQDMVAIARASGRITRLLGYWNLSVLATL